MAEAKEEAPPTKACTKCGEHKTFDQYYKAGPRYRGACKKCHNESTNIRSRARRGNPPLRGFAALSAEQQQKIITEVAAGKDMMQIAIDNGVHLDRLRYWKSVGKLTPAAPAP